MMEQKHAPWKLQRKLKLEDIPPQEVIINTARQFADQQERALFILAYQTAGRLSEIIPTEYLRKVKYKKQVVTDELGNQRLKILYNIFHSPKQEEIKRIELNYPGIRKDNITFSEMGDKQIMYVSMQNRKNRKLKRKILPIPIHRERPLVDMLQSYLNTLDESEPLFDFRATKARKIIKKVGYNPHFLRDIRLTHMVTIYDFDSYRLVKFAGWKDPRPAEAYVRLSNKDLIEKY